METLKALASLGPSVAVILVCLVLIVFVAAAVFGGLDLQAGSPKWFTVKMSKRQNVEVNRPRAEPVPEPPMLAADASVALLHEPVPQEPEDNEKDEVDGLS